MKKYLVLSLLLLSACSTLPRKVRTEQREPGVNCIRCFSSDQHASEACFIDVLRNIDKGQLVTVYHDGVSAEGTFVKLTLENEIEIENPITICMSKGSSYITRPHADPNCYDTHIQTYIFLNKVDFVLVNGDGEGQ